MAARVDCHLLQREGAGGRKRVGFVRMEVKGPVRPPAGDLQPAVSSMIRNEI